MINQDHRSVEVNEREQIDDPFRGIGPAQHHARAGSDAAACEKFNGAG